MSVLFVVVALTLLISAFCSLLEAMLYSTRMVTLEAAAKVEAKRSAALRFLDMKHNLSSPTSAILILNTIANTAGASLAGMYAADVMGHQWVPAFSLGLTFGILFLSEILPKTYGATHWRSIWTVFVWPLAFIETALKPLIRVTQAFAHMFAGRKIAPAMTEDELLAMIELGVQAGEVSHEEMRMMGAVLRLDELLCRQVMVPRGEVVYLDVNDPIPESLMLARKTQHTRYPLCDGSLDKVLGIVHVKDLVGRRVVDLRSVMRPVQHVPETKRIDRLLAEMRKSRQHIGVVVDEHGSTVGIVTLENILEEIVGSVQDEFDREARDLFRDKAGSYIALGGMSLEKLKNQLGLQIGFAEVNTLSGLLGAELGRFPEVGDRVELPGAVAEVLEAEGNRARKVRLTLRPRGGAGQEAGS